MGRGGVGWGEVGEVVESVGGVRGGGLFEQDTRHWREKQAH